MSTHGQISVHTFEAELVDETHEWAGVVERGVILKTTRRHERASALSRWLLHEQQLASRERAASHLHVQQVVAHGVLRLLHDATMRVEHAILKASPKDGRQRAWCKVRRRPRAAPWLQEHPVAASVT